MFRFRPRPGVSMQLVVVGLTPAGVERRTAAATGVARPVARVNDFLTGGPTLNLPDGLGLPAEEFARWLDAVRARATGR
jgi:hypothetical protein